MCVRFFVALPHIFSDRILAMKYPFQFSYVYMYQCVHDYAYLYRVHVCVIKCVPIYVCERVCVNACIYYDCACVFNFFNTNVDCN